MDNLVIFSVNSIMFGLEPQEISVKSVKKQGRNGEKMSRVYQED